MVVYTPKTASQSDSDDDVYKMSFIYFNNDFPGGDLQDQLRHLHTHSKDKSHPVLAQFIQEATRAVKDEIQTLPTELRTLLPSFDNIFTWADNTELREGLICGAVDGVLLIVTQLASYIGHLERHPDELPSVANAGLCGLGIGLLASTAVALSSTVADLALTGADAVRLAFRLGIHVFGVSENLEARDLSEKPDTWAYVLHRVDPTEVQAELDSIHARSETPATGKVFISAVSPTSVTISAPPSRLKKLFNKSEFFRKVRSLPLPVFGGLCHAPHIYGADDVKSIVHGSPLHTIKARFAPQLSVYSTSTGIPYNAPDAESLYECVVSELLEQAIYWHKTSSGIADYFKSSGACHARLYSFGNSLPLNDLAADLKSATPDAEISTSDLVSWIWLSGPDSATPRGPAQAKLAIVGMSCRLPGGATSNEKFWQILEKGLDVSRQIPADRFDISTHYDPTGKDLNKTMTQYGCFIDEPGMFDAPFFNMSPREAQVVDPQMRLSLVTAYEALEQAGFVPNRTASTQLDRIGTYYGQAADDYREVNQGQEVSTYYIPGGCRAFGPGRINYFFKFAGPSYSIDTACSSGLAAIQVACQALWCGDIDMAVTGGVNVLTNPDGFAGLCNGHFLTKGANACKTWDATADGYCRADGIGSLVIKRLEDAEADNDNILGVILGAGTNHSAEAVSITHPHAGHQSDLSRQVLHQAGVNPLDVSYVELHGTGTQAGDFEEIKGIMDVYAPITKRRTKDKPLHIGAVKANVGHGESVAGTTALIKVLMMLQKNAIPRHVGIKTGMNPRFPEDFGQRNLHIPFEMTPWTRGDRKRIAAVNNFGAAGGNTTMVLEEGPSRAEPEADPRPVHVITVSAKNKTSLTGNVEALLAYLDANPETSLAHLSYTTTARRYQHTHRLAFACSSLEQLRKQLTTSLGKIDTIKPVAKSGPPSIAFSFTGQGASYRSMSLELYQHVTTFRQHINRLDSLAQSQGFPSFIPALDGSHDKDHEHSPVVTQLALVSSQMALAKYWASLGVQPDVVVGHSLGEYAAMHVAGVITASDVLFMVGRRAQMLQEKCRSGSHCMMAVRASLKQIADTVGDKPYTIACINSPSDTVLSGTSEQVDDVAVLLEAAGFRCIKLPVAFAFHSEQVDPLLDEFEAMCKSGVHFQEPNVPFISPLLGKVVFDGKTLNANYARRATREPVDFISALDTARKVSTISDDTVWIEIGPHPVCTGFVKSTIPTTQTALASIRRGEDNTKTMSESMTALHLAGVKLDWNEFQRPFESRLRLVDLPTYSWNEKNYWLQYNGDWCLTKGNTFYGSDTSAADRAKLGNDAKRLNGPQTSTVQDIIEEHFEGSSGTVVMQSDLMQPDFLAAANGHRMNDCGVVTSSIHADIAYTLGGYLYKKLVGKTNETNMNIANLVVSKGLVANSNMKAPQLIRVTATTADMRSGVVDLTWENVSNDGVVSEPFATANIFFGESAEWLDSWSPMAHLIQGRIESLERMAADGKASRLSHNMAYTLFAANLVDYAEKYRGMQSVVVNELEGFADIELTSKESGVWTVPPYFIDSVAHLAGFIMNCSDSMDCKNKYCVTPGWKTMRFAKPLIAGNKYRSYVKMIPTAQDPTVYFGDVYIMHEDEIVGMVGGIQFRSFPRILLSRFFSPPDKGLVVSAPAAEAKTHMDKAVSQTTVVKAAVPAVAAAAAAVVPTPQPAAPAPAPTQAPAPAATAPVAAAAGAGDSLADKALAIIAREAAMEVSSLEDDASFDCMGIDSLMSLVVVEKLRLELNVKVGGSLFLDYPTIGDFRQWLEEYSP